MKSTMVLAATLLLVGACSKAGQESTITHAKKVVVSKVKNALYVESPLGTKDDPRLREQQRFNAEWLRLRSVQDAARQRAAAEAAAQRQKAAEASASMQFVAATDKAFGESLAKLDPSSVDSSPVHVPIRGDVGGPSVLRAQVLLDRSNYSVGAIDGRWGRNSAIAVYWFQHDHGLDTTGEVDEETFRALAASGAAEPMVERHTLTDDDVKGPFVSIPEDVYEKEKLDCLCYESLLEKLAEKFHVSQELLQLMNRDVDFSSLRAGSTIFAPKVRAAVPENTTPDIGRIVISVRGSYLRGFGFDGRPLFYAPTTLGSKYDPSPHETVKLVEISHDPHFHYQPTLFHEVPDSDPEAHLSPGPNSPVGVVWMALSKPHYGIHGTSDPESIGYASSHGCVRLTNWDAHDLSYRVAKGIDVEFVDTSKETN